MQTATFTTTSMAANNLFSSNSETSGQGLLMCGNDRFANNYYALLRLLIICHHQLLRIIISYYIYGNYFIDRTCLVDV